MTSRADGSWSSDDPDRPNLTADMEIVAIYRYDDGEGRYLSSKIKGENANGKAIRTGRLLGGNELQIAKLEQPHDFYKHPKLTNYIRGDGGHPPVLYRLTELIADLEARPNDAVFIVEGEKDVDRLREGGLIATTNPNGAGKWRADFSTRLVDRDIAIIPDNDERGRDHAEKVTASVERFAKSVRVVDLPGVGENGDVSEYLENGHSIHELLELVEKAVPRGSGSSAGDTGASASRPAPGEFSTNEDGVPYRTIRNARIAIDRLGTRLSFDEFSNRYLIDGLSGFGPVLDDAALTRMRLTMEEEWGLIFGKDRWFDIATDEARRNTFHPVRQYLDRLHWDGETRLDTWLSKYGGAEESEYTRAVSAIALIAAVRRVRKPGCKFDEMLVLESEQGTEKSSALTILAVNEEWFTDDCPLNADSKMMIEQIGGRWLVEMGELKGMRRGEVEHVKSTLSRRVDKARLAYGRMPVEQPRQCVFFGTTNDSAYLRDMTGNRRFWPVRVRRFDLKALRADRDQIWAEAAAREAKGESIRLPESLWSVAGEHQAAREVGDPIHDTLAERLDGLEGKVRACDIWEAIGLGEVGKRTQDHNVRLSAAMQRLGWRRPKSKLRFNGPPQHAWIKGPDGIAVSALDEVPRAVVLGQGEYDGRAM